MPNKADIAIKFLLQELTDRKLDPRTDSESVLDTYKNDPTISEEIRSQLKSYVATKKGKGNWQSYWCRLRRTYLNEFQNLDPARNGLGPGPIQYPRRTLRFEGDKKGTETEDTSRPTERPRQEAHSEEEEEEEEEEEGAAAEEETEEEREGTPSAAPYDFSTNRTLKQALEDIEKLCLGSPRPKQQRSERPQQNQDIEMSIQVPMGLTTIRQESNTGITLATKAIVWQDSLLSMHCQILVWLPSGINGDNFEASVHVKILTLTFPSAELLYNAQEFEEYYRGFLTEDNRVENMNTFQMIQTHRNASRMMEEAEANILSLAVTEVKMTLPFVCEAKFSNSAGYIS
jgi:hypothetical protein